MPLAKPQLPLRRKPPGTFSAVPFGATLAEATACGLLPQTSRWASSG